MGIVLDISTTRLRSGDSITFNFAFSVSFTIDVINPTSQPATLQVQGTSDVVPTENEWLVAVDRLEDAISSIGLVSSVTSNDTVISIEFTDSTAFLSFSASTANGSLINGVRIVGEDGSVTNLGSPLVPNIRVTNTTHRLIDYTGYVPETFPHGNVSDRLETVISFTTAGTFAILDFYYGWTDNNTVIYPSGSSGEYQIDKGFFTDITTGALQKYTGNTASINAVNPLQGNKVESINLAFLGGNDYTLTIIHYIPILPRPFDRTVDNGLNKPVEIETSLKMLFQIDLKADLITPNASESTSKENLTQFLQNGNIGYFGEVYQTGQTFYTLNSFVWNNAQNELNSGLLTSGTLVINKTSAFTSVSDVTIKIQKLTDVFNESEKQLQNYDYESLKVVLDGTPVAGTNIVSAVGTFSGTTATINFDIAAASYTGAYALYVSCSEGTAIKDNQNILVKVSDAINAADDTTVVFGTFTGSTRAEYNFNLHYLDNIADSFNEVKSFIDDFVLCRFRVQDNNTLINTFNSLTIRIRDNNTVLETFNVTSSELNNNTVTIERDFNLLPSDLRKNITFTDNGDGTIDVVYPFQILDNWVSAENVVLETIANYTQATAEGDLDFTNNFISPVFDLGQYNLSKNGVSDPQVTLPPSNIKFYDEAAIQGGSPLNDAEVGVILSNAKTRVIATFEEDNLNDFLADPSAPFTYPDNTPIENYLTAYLGINTNNNVQSEYIRFHNLRDNEVSVWESVQVGYYAELVRLDIDTATLTAVLDNEKLKEVFGEDFNCLKVTARLDKIQTAQVTAKAYKNDAYSNGYS